MGSSRPRGARQRAMAWLLAVAFAPSLLFVGHWPSFAVALPGTGLSIGLPAAGQAHSHAGGSTHAHDEHAAHCHAEMASCSGQPFTGGATVAALQEIASAAIAGGALLAVAAAVAVAPRGRSLRPPVEPPRPRWA